MVFPNILRRAVEMSQARDVASAYAARVLRESSTLCAAIDVWSDVASARGLGFRAEEAGPLLHGDLRSGGAFEMGISEDRDGQYATLAGVRLPRPLIGSVAVRPHDLWTRALARLVRPPANLPVILTSAFSVRASPADVAALVLTPKLQETLTLLADRRPRVHARGEELLLVLEGVELAHERIEAIVEAFETLSPAEGTPYR